MKVTKVEIKMPKAPQNRRMQCWANVILDDELIIKGIRVYETNVNNEIRRWIKLPERQMPFSLTGGEIHNIPIVMTLSKEFFAHITNEIFKEFDLMTK